MSTKLLQALEAATEADLAELDAEIGKAVQRLDGLKAARKLVAAKLGRGEKRKSSAPRAAKPDKPLIAAVGILPLHKLDAARREVGRYLAKHGPVRPDTLAAALAIPESRFGRVMECEWFTQSAQGWHLTPVGRAATSDD